jgi:hypothetical protein
LWILRAAAVVLGLIATGSAAEEGTPVGTPPVEAVRADFSNVRGLNYIASYAASDVAMWRHYDRDQVDRELGFVEGLGANSVRVWLAWVVFDVEGDQFLQKFRDFLSLCQKHRLTVMPILWDSCFGDPSAGYDDVDDWVANPGTERVADPAFRVEGDRYVRAVVEAGRESPALLVWDVMNEPSGKGIREWLEHYCRLVKSLDPGHPVTIGWAHAGSNETSAGWVDVMSYHPYGIFDKNRRVWTEAVRDVARRHGNKPILATEAGAPGWGQRYEECLRFFEQEKVGFYLFEATSGTNRFRDVTGFFYPDGSAREMEPVRAFQALARRQGAAAEKEFSTSDRPVPYAKAGAREVADLILHWDDREMTLEDYPRRETLLRWTLISLAWGGALKDHLEQALKLRAEADAAKKAGDTEAVKDTLSKLARLAAKLLVEHEFVSEPSSKETSDAP